MFDDYFGFFLWRCVTFGMVGEFYEESMTFESFILFEDVNLTMFGVPGQPWNAWHRPGSSWRWWVGGFKEFSNVFSYFFPMFFQMSFHSFPIVSNVAHIFSKLPICFMFHSFLQFSPSFPTNPRLRCNLVFGTSESHNSVWEIRKKNSPVFEGMTCCFGRGFSTNHQGWEIFLQQKCCNEIQWWISVIPWGLHITLPSGYD